MTDNPQPEALRLALSIDLMDTFTNYQQEELGKAAAELRRQHNRIAELESELEAIGAGGIEPLRRRECLHQISEPAPAGKYPALPESELHAIDTAPEWWAIPHYEQVSDEHSDDPDVVNFYTSAQMRAYVDADRAMRAQAAPTPSEWDVRGRLAASLTCWHRLTGQEAAELVALFQGHPAQAAPAAVAVPDGWQLVPVGPTQSMLGKADGLTCIDFTALGEEGAFTNDELRAIYQAMLAAAPRPPADHLRGATKMISHARGCRANAFGQCDKGCTEAHEQFSRDALDAARYRWLRDGNGYAPEECGITGGEELDELCDEGVATQAQQGGV